MKELFVFKVHETSHGFQVYCPKDGTYLTEYNSRGLELYLASEVDAKITAIEAKLEMCRKILICYQDIIVETPDGEIDAASWCLSKLNEE